MQTLTKAGNDIDISKPQNSIVTASSDSVLELYGGRSIYGGGLKVGGLYGGGTGIGAWFGTFHIDAVF